MVTTAPCVSPLRGSNRFEKEVKVILLVWCFHGTSLTFVFIEDQMYKALLRDADTKRLLGNSELTVSISGTFRLLWTYIVLEPTRRLRQICNVLTVNVAIKMIGDGARKMRSGIRCTTAIYLFHISHLDAIYTRHPTDMYTVMLGVHCHLSSRPLLRHPTEFHGRKWPNDIENDGMSHPENPCSRRRRGFSERQPFTKISGGHSWPFPSRILCSNAIYSRENDE